LASLKQKLLHFTISYSHNNRELHFGKALYCCWPGKESLHKILIVVVDNAMEKAPHPKPQRLIIFSPAAERPERFSARSTDTLNEHPDKQKLLGLTPNVVIPATPARETSEFFDNLNNLDPVKFSPPDSSQTAKKAAMPDL